MNIKADKPAMYKGKKVNVFGIDSNKISCAIEWEDGDIHNNRIVYIRELLPRKKPDELGKGDKFKDEIDNNLKIINVEFDEYHNKKIYITKRLDGYAAGSISLHTPQNIKEIIYD